MGICSGQGSCGDSMTNDLSLGHDNLNISLLTEHQPRSLYNSSLGRNMKTHFITIINDREISITSAFIPYAYRNLMEFIVNELDEDIGACKGKAWCGTCHGVVVQGNFEPEDIIGDEIKTLQRLSTLPQSRLACQIMLGPELDGMVFKIIGDN